MKLTLEQITEIKNLGKKYQNMDFDEFLKELRDKSKEMKIEYKTLLNLILNKKFLINTINNQVEEYDQEIARIEVLKAEKECLCSLVCSLHGHEYDWEPFNEYQTCIYCGNKFKVTGIEANKYLGESKVLSQKFYSSEK